MSDIRATTLPPSALPTPMEASPLAAYVQDAAQRGLMVLDVLRQRGDAFLKQQNDADPHVLQFDATLLIDGRDLPAPVNYRLMRIHPPAGTQTDPTKRPFIVFDPRAGQGPGIGGMKKDSEIGLALAGGHPVYFVSFLPEPVEGQTIEAACEAEAHFVRQVIGWHPDADKPCLIGNCQAGWQIALMAALNPALAGVLVLAGAPLSYWAGTKGQSPMRYTAGLSGGSWLNAFLSDLGGGQFDGTWLVQSFEMGNPAHTYWKKPHDLYTRIDTEAPRFLAFERWWGLPVLLDAREIQFIADELFIGNHLARGEIHTPAGLRVDLRNIRSPIVVFCSQGDEITPPQQALGWIPDLYACDEDIVAAEQTIVYAMHEQIGHLGLFVSSAVMAKELSKFIGAIDMIETLPPGLYEARFLPKDTKAAHADLASGDYILRFEQRSVEDIRKLGVTDLEEERCFETVARFSENLQGLYHTFVAPFVRTAVTKDLAALLRQMHPVRASFAFFSSENPLLAGLPAAAQAARDNRQPIGSENPFWVLQEAISAQILQSLNALNELRSRMAESLFFAFYSSPWLQASLGLRTVRPYAKPRPERDVQREQERSRRLLHLQAQIEEGGLAEAMVRGLLYLCKGQQAIDERAFRLLARLREETDLLPPRDQGTYRSMVRQQDMMLHLDTQRALRALPNLLERSGPKARQAFDVIRQVFEASGPLSPEDHDRLDQLADLFVPSGTTPRRRATDKRGA